jgi:hypothetical protein
MKRSFTMKRKLFHIAGALALVLAGCASVPEAPEEFETTGSLAGTGWSGMQGEAIETLLNINDAESGVFISMEGEELPFTYTAVYDAEKKSFTGRSLFCHKRQAVENNRRGIGTGRS